MKLEDQLCTKSQALKLKALGINGEGECLFSWHQAFSEPHSISWSTKEWVRDGGKPEWVGAYTGTELGIMLPEFIRIKTKEYLLSEWRNEATMLEQFPISAEDEFREHRIAYREKIGDCIGEIGDNFREVTEAQVRARMLIYLLESKIVTPEEINKRLTR